MSRLLQGILILLSLVLLSVAGFGLTDYDVRTIVAVVALAFIVVACLVEALDQGYW